MPRANTFNDFIRKADCGLITERGCWEWRGRKVRGYGAFDIDSTTKLAHRVAYEVFVGVQAEDKVVMHLCDNPPCINPFHLRLGTQDENNKDRMLKGRSAVGERAGRSKLTEDAVKEIRNLYQTGKYTTKELGSKFGVSDHQISMVCLRKAWRHI